MGRKYEFIREIGEGGMSMVYLAKDKKLSMRWTIKKIDLSRGEYIAECVKREALALRRLRSDRIARLTDLYREGNKICLCMEYVEGKSLKEVIKENKNFASDNASVWAEELAETLVLLHSLDPPLIYRDMKPGNIILKPDGHLCLIDFGAARIKEDARNDPDPVGTKKYAPPEQFMGYADERSDIYSLGKTIEAAAGGKAAHGLKKIIEKAVCPDPGRRYQTAAEMLAEVRKYNQMKKRKPVITALSALLVLLILSMAFAFGRADKESINAADYRKQLEQEKIEYLRLSVDSGNPADALDKIDEYTDERDGEYLEELSYECGVAALFELSDFERAFGYFCRADSSTRPEAAYLKSISKELSVISDDKSGIMKVLNEFRKFSVNIEDSDEKVRNLIYIAKTEILISPMLGDEIRSERLEQAFEDIKIAEELLKGSEIKKDVKAELTDIGFILARDLLEAGHGEYKKIAFQYGMDWLRMTKGSENKDIAIRRIKELDEICRPDGGGENRSKIIGFYEEVEELYPYDLGEIYLHHIELLRKTKGKEEEINYLLKKASLCNDMEKIDERIYINEEN